MLGMLVKVFSGHSIATRGHLPRKGNVTFEDLMRGAADFHVRTVTIEVVTSLRCLLPITVRIVAVLKSARSAILSCSHEPFTLIVNVGYYRMWAYRKHLRNRMVWHLFFCAPARSHSSLDGLVLISNNFLMQCSAESGLGVAVSLFKPRRIKDRVVAAIAELCCTRAQRFESVFLHR
jgi:hypothetical protein